MQKLSLVLPICQIPEYVHKLIDTNFMFTYISRSCVLKVVEIFSHIHKSPNPMTQGWHLPSEVYMADGVPSSAFGPSALVH